MLDLRVDNFYSFLFLRRVIIINSNNISNTYLVYKFYNINDELLYVGITNDIKIRLRQHKQKKKWFKNVDKIYISNNTMSRNEAHIYEIYYIANNNPKYNIDYMNGGKVDFMLDELIFEEYIVGKRRKINIDIVLNMYNSGKSIEDIASELGYSNEYISQNLNSKLIELGEKKKGRRNCKDERFEVFINCLKVLSNNIYFTIDDILNKFLDDYECALETAKMYYKDEFKNILDDQLEKLGYKRIRANKEIKDKYNIDSLGYPSIIVNIDKLIN